MRNHCGSRAAHELEAELIARQARLCQQGDHHFVGTYKFCIGCGISKAQAKRQAKGGAA